ncbi:MAG TPA: hypothetical protein VIL21_01885 [Solirubrobacterales bacterium]
MKYVKMLGLLAVAAAAMMAFAGTASATVLKSEGSTYTGTIHGESEGKTTLHGPADISCEKSTVAGPVETHGAGVTVEGNISTLDFSECNAHVTVVSAGRLSVHAITPTGNGTLTSNGAKITVQITNFISCEYETQNTHIGTVTGSSNLGGKTATMHIDSSLIPRVRHSIFCGSTGEWTGSYTVTSPMTLDVH